MISNKLDLQPETLFYYSRNNLAYSTRWQASAVDVVGEFDGPDELQQGEVEVVAGVRRMDDHLRQVSLNFFLCSEIS
jgi:hypothetical protein